MKGLSGLQRRPVVSIAAKGVFWRGWTLHPFGCQEAGQRAVGAGIAALLAAERGPMRAGFCRRARSGPTGEKGKQRQLPTAVQIACRKDRAACCPKGAERGDGALLLCRKNRLSPRRALARIFDFSPLFAYNERYVYGAFCERGSAGWSRPVPPLFNCTAQNCNWRSFTGEKERAIRIALF